MSSLLNDLAGQVDAANVLSRAADVTAYSYDAQTTHGERRAPVAVVFPASADEVAGVVRVCAHHGVSAIARGAGTSYTQGPVAAGVVIVCLTRMNRVLGVDTAARQIRVEAGVLISTVRIEARAAHLRFPLDPGSSATATVGGSIATNLGGPRSLAHGRIGAFVVGVTAVLGDGRIVEVGDGADGSAATMGRERVDDGDLLTALVGSEGTVAIVTSAVLRLVAPPVQRAVMTGRFTSFGAAVAATRGILERGVKPAAIECLDASAATAVVLSGFASLDDTAAALVIVELEGDDLTGDAGSVRAVFEAQSAEVLELTADPVDAQRMALTRHAVSVAMASVANGKCNVDLRVSDIDGARRTVIDAAKANDIRVALFAHPSSDLLHLTILADQTQPHERARSDATLLALREALGADAIVGRHDVGTAHETPAAAAWGDGAVDKLRTIRHATDPRGVFGSVADPIEVAAGA